MCKFASFLKRILFVSGGALVIAFILSTIRLELPADVHVMNKFEFALGSTVMHLKVVLKTKFFVNTCRQGGSQQYGA